MDGSTAPSRREAALRAALAEYLGRRATEEIWERALAAADQVQPPCSEEQRLLDHLRADGCRLFSATQEMSGDIVVVVVCEDGFRRSSGATLLDALRAVGRTVRSERATPRGG